MTDTVHPDAARPAAVLIGPPAAGKTRIGKRVARALDAEFLDTDRMIVERYGPIPDIFANEGEATFRAYERDAVADALAIDGAVVALGGGAVMTPETAERLTGMPVVLLTLSAEAVAARLEKSASTRPLVAGGLAQWEELVARRTPTYERLARATWDTSTFPADRIALDIADWVRAGAPERKDAS
ncbi:MAG TPA: shikimate kinase [Microcella sp.]|nr:shikimate kinase [Microcella sp.]